MKLRDSVLWLVVIVASGFAGCAVCDTCDDFPLPCSGPNCGSNGMPAYMTGGEGPAVMGSGSPAAPAMDDSAGPGPMTPANAPMSSPTLPAPSI